MWTAQAVVDKINSLPTGECAVYADVGFESKYTLLVKRHNSRRISVHVVEQDGAFDKYSNRYKDKILHRYKRVPNELIPYVVGKAFTYERRKDNVH